MIYCPSSSSLPRDFLDGLGAILNSAATHPGESIICGDFNLHFGNTESTAALHLANLLDNAGFVQHVTSTTHMSRNILDGGVGDGSFFDDRVFCKIDISYNRSPCGRM